LVLLGAIANAGSSIHYRKYFRDLAQGGQKPFAAWSLAIWVAIASAMIGFLLIIYLLVVDVSTWKADLTPATASSNVRMFFRPLI
jgi:hypothetical protein